MADYLHQMLEIPVKLWNPFESPKISLGEGMKEMRAQGPLFSVCLGLAARTDKS